MNNLTPLMHYLTILDSNGNGGTWQSKELLELIKTNFIHNTTNKIKRDANISVKNLKSKFGLENDSAMHQLKGFDDLQSIEL